MIVRMMVMVMVMVMVMSMVMLMLMVIVMVMVINKHIMILGFLFVSSHIERLVVSCIRDFYELKEKLDGVGPVDNRPSPD